MNRHLLAVAILLGSTVTAQSPLTVKVSNGSPAFDFYGEGPYRAGVPRPDSLLGYPIGNQHTMYHQQQAVLEAMVAAAPDRARFEVTGKTAEGKVMRVVVIGSPASLSRLETIRGDLDDLADPRRTDQVRADAIMASSPAVAFLSHSIHGNEPAGFESSLMTVYTLLASESPRVARLLDSLVVIINPSQNPDGHERFAAWSNSVAMGLTESAALESRANEPWSIQGRFNHYRFDMNRDLLALSQSETRATASAVLRWRPQVFVDLHSTTAQYFFPPSASPINANIGRNTVDWLERFGKANGAAFDVFGWQYFVRDVFDLFYPGYWDSWPSLLGSTGMTFESDGGPLLATRKSDGTVTTFREGIAHHFVASMATLTTLADNRHERLQDYRQFFEASLSEPANREFRRVVIAPGTDVVRTREVVELLRFQGIEVTESASPFTVQGAHDYLGGASRSREFPRGSFVIDMAQPHGRLATAILEPTATLDSVFARKQLDRFERNRRRGSNTEREGYEFYDVTGWSLPMTHGLDAVWTAAQVVVEAVDPADRIEYDLQMLQPARSGYLIPSGTRNSQSLALALLAEGFNVGVSTTEMVADDREWPAGTMVLRTVRNADSLHNRLATLQLRFPTAVVPVQSAFAGRGQAGIGSGSVDVVHAPRVLVAAGPGVSQTDFGDVWWYLENELHQRFVPVDPEDFGRVDLDEFNVIVLPPGRYLSIWQDDDLHRLRDWVRGGGSLIVMGSSGDLLGHTEMGLREGTDEEIAEGLATEADTTLSASAEPGPIVSPGALEDDRPESVPGAIAVASLDPLHWLGWGYRVDELAVPVPSSLLSLSKEGSNVVVFDSEQPIISGFSWPGNTERHLPGTAWATVDRAGRGNVIAFANNPLFRGFWRGTAMLFVNAMLLGTGR